MNFANHRISVKGVIVVLSRNGIYVDDCAADLILGFLYLISKNMLRSKMEEFTHATHVR